jgi:hypothetical protein
MSVIQNIALHCSVTLRNAELYESARQAESKVVSLLEVHPLRISSLLPQT